MPAEYRKAQLATILARIRSLAQSQLASAKLGLLTFPDDPHFVPSDHLTYLHRHLAPNVPRYYLDKLCYGTAKDAPLIRILTEIEAREAHIHRRLGHIVVNPHDEFNTRALVGSYCYASDSDADHTVHNSIANWNEESALSFMGSVIDIAQKQSDLLRTNIDRQNRSLQVDRTIFLHGARGAGKTFFENFLLSRFYSLLDERRVIWVRINLVNKMGYDNALMEWIHSQAAKIIMRYYNQSSLYFKKAPSLAIDVQSHFVSNVLPRKNRKERGAITAMMNKAQQVFHRGGHPSSGIDDEALDQSLLSGECASEVVAAARLKGFHFVVVLDGLDVLEITRAYRSRFESLVNQTFQIANSNKRNGFALIVATRSNTLRNILQREFHDTYSQTISEEYEVKPVPLKSVLKKRIAYIKREIVDICNKTSCAWRVNDVDSHMDEFERFLAGSDPLQGASSSWQFVDTLEQMQGDNIRAQMQMVQFRYYEYFVKRNKGRLPYHAVEAMLKAGRRFPPIPYRYFFDGTDLIRTNWHHQKYDSRFFPSLFRFPFVSGSVPRARDRVKLQGDLTGITLEYVLLGVRIIQFAELWQREVQEQIARREHPMRDEIVVGEFCDLLEFCFGYRRPAVIAALEELSEYQVLEFRNPNLNVSSVNVEDNVVVPLPKMRHLLKQSMSDVAYLNMAAMRIPLPDSAFGRNVSPYFQAASYEEDDDDLLQWVACKVMNAVGLLRLMTELDRRQQELIASRIRDQAIDSDDFWITLINRARKDKVVGFANGISDAIIKQCELAITGMNASNEDLRRFQLQLEAYETSWPSRSL